MSSYYIKQPSFKILLAVSVFILILANCSPGSSNVESQIIYFIEDNSNGTFQLYRSNLNRIQDKELLPNIVLTNFSYFSPNGEFVAIIDNDQLKILALDTEMLITAVDFGIQPNYIKPHQNVSWSSDSRMFVFSRYLPIENEVELHSQILIYDIEKQEWAELVDNDDFKSTPTFSFDTQQIIYSKISTCESNPFTCAQEEQLWNLESLNLGTQNSTNSYQIHPDNYDIKIGVESSLICNLDSARNNLLFAFQSFCITEGIPVFSEVFVLNSMDKEIFQLTKFGDVDFSNSYSYTWTPDNNYFILGFRHDYIFDNSRDKSGFITYKVGEFDVQSSHIDVENLILFETEWSPDGNYVLSRIGPNSTSVNSTFVGQISPDGEVLPLSDSLPIFSLKGCWIKDGYITQIEDRVIKLTFPELEILDLDIKLDKDIKIFGCFPNI